MTAVSETMRQTILNELHKIASDEHVQILFAIESGFRAWGFHSHGSDYDVRFAYARPVSRQLQLQDRRDIIERPISGKLDISGLEISEALGLALRSNAVLPEWLQSPIRYIEAPGTIDAISQFCREVPMRRPAAWHYLSLFRGQLSHLATPEGKTKLSSGEMGVAAVMHPLVDAMIDAEVGHAEQWLANYEDPARAHHWTRANELNRLFTLQVPDDDHP
jgi:hypothetical protein